MTEDTIPATSEEQFDFSGDSTVEQIEGVWTITEAESEATESNNGTGTRHIITFENPELLPFPVSVRQFVSYESRVGKDTTWLKRSRGVLKNIAKAATGEPRYTLPVLVGRTVRARTKDDGNGFYTLTGFRPATQEAVA